MAPKVRNPLERFMEKVRRAENGCWQWIGDVGKAGYGRFWFCGKNVLAHRWSYEFHAGPIPDGLHIDHLCRNTSCVNPDHLEPVTPAENILRGTGPQRVRERCEAITHCPRGHEYTEENTYRGGHGRTCVTCKKASARKGYEQSRRVTIERAREWRLANPERAREIGREVQRRRRARLREEGA